VNDKNIMEKIMKKINKKIKTTLFAVCAVIVGFGAVFAPVYKNNVISASAETTLEESVSEEYTYNLYFTYGANLLNSVTELNDGLYNNFSFVYNGYTIGNFNVFVYTDGTIDVLESNTLYLISRGAVSGSYVYSTIPAVSLFFELPSDFVSSLNLSFNTDGYASFNFFNEWRLSNSDFLLKPQAYMYGIIERVPVDKGDGFLSNVYDWSYDYFFSDNLPDVMQPVAEELCVLLSLFMLVLLFTPVIAVIYLFIRFFGSFARW